MQQLTAPPKKTLLLNLFLFYVLYFTLVLTERQLIRKDLLWFKLPFKPDLLETLAGLGLGSAVIIGISLALRKQERILRLILVAGLLGGSILLNVFLFRSIYYPPFDRMPAGDLQFLGENRLQPNFSFDLSAAVYQDYYLKTIVANPNLEDFQEITQSLNLESSLQQSQTAPPELTAEQFTRLQDSASSSPRVIQHGKLEYRLYPGQDPGEMLLTRYKDLILVFPGGWIGE